MHDINESEWQAIMERAREQARKNNEEYLAMKARHHAEGLALAEQISGEKEIFRVALGSHYSEANRDILIAMFREQSRSR